MLKINKKVEDFMKQENDVVQDVNDDKHHDSLNGNSNVSRARTTFVKFLVKLDVWINDYLLFGKSETLSARMGRSMESDNPNPIAVFICDFLNTVQKDHCKKAYQAVLDKQEGKLNDFKG